MSRLWSESGTDAAMQLYECTSTGFERGLLQAVPAAVTLGQILLESTDGAAAAPREPGARDSMVASAPAGASSRVSLYDGSSSRASLYDAGDSTATPASASTRRQSISMAIRESIFGSSKDAADSAKTGKSAKGGMVRKLVSAGKALGDRSVLKEWLARQALQSKKDWGDYNWDSFDESSPAPGCVVEDLDK